MFFVSLVVSWCMCMCVFYGVGGSNQFGRTYGRAIRPYRGNILIFQYCCTTITILYYYYYKSNNIISTNTLYSAITTIVLCSY